MKLTKITPSGFCKGVIDAYTECKKIVELYPNNEKYLIGWLVHNNEVIKELKDMGIQIKEDDKSDRDKIVDAIKINDFNYPPIVIFSAHGTDQKVIDKAKQKGLIVLDTTCAYVTKTCNLIKEKIANGYQVIYIGVKNHPETIATLAIDQSIILVETSVTEINFLVPENKQIFVTNQTTISVYEFRKIIELLQQKFKNIEFKNDICDAAKIRQEAIINMPTDVDLLLVVGDNKSNNSKKLVEIGSRKKIESHLVWDSNKIKKTWFINKKHVAITSGCSTPTWLTNYVIMFLKKNWDFSDD